MDDRDKLVSMFNEIKGDLEIVKQEMQSLITYLEIYKNTSNEHSD
jgi:hypothetical protein